LSLTYHSSAIEGSTLSLNETKVVLEGYTIGGKALKEHLEIINHRETIIYILKLLSDKELLTLWHIKCIHQLILQGIDKDNAGKYRRVNVVISGSNKKPTDYVLINDEMEKLMVKYNNWGDYHPLIRAALLHAEFVFIHPFVDGNGRVARLLMNFEAIKSGYLPIIIKLEDRAKYYNSLEKANLTNDYTDFIKLITEREIELIDKYLEMF
jgi:Fic family protein